MTSLFHKNKRNIPLSARIRPQNFKEFIGQEHCLAPHKPLRELIENDNFHSMIISGPPGTGKTSLAHIIKQKTAALFLHHSSIDMTVKEIRTIIKKAEFELNHSHKETILFLDEIHRFSKSQQDSLLHAIEEGIIRFIGMTTHNPKFCLTNALLSRSQIFYFEEFTQKQLQDIILNTLKHPQGFPKKNIEIDDYALNVLSQIHDIRQIFYVLDQLISSIDKETIKINEEILHNLDLTKNIAYSNEEHYDFISAFIKSMRNNNPDGAIYCLARMLDGGEDPTFIARRLVIFSSEDIGNADPRALSLTQSCFDAVYKIGMPEGRIILAQATIYCASAPKSRRSYEAINKALEDVKKKPPIYPDETLTNQFSMRQKKEASFKKTYYHPSKSGYEKYIHERLQFLRDKNDKK